MDVSLDFETLGFHLHACPFEFGAVLFNPETGEQFEKMECSIDLKDAIVNYDCRAYPSVTSWWRDRGLPSDEEALNLNFKISEFLSMFRKFLPESFDGRVWAKNPAFDVGILERLYLLDFKGDFSLELPWKYNKVRDLTQLKEMAVFLGYVPNKENGVIAHRALKDAVEQAKEIHEIFKYIESVNSLRF